MNRSQDLTLRNLRENLPPWRQEPFQAQGLATPRAAAQAQPLREATAYRPKGAAPVQAGGLAARDAAKEGARAGCSASGPPAGP
ncbi:hypothetical protein JCM14713_11780 [Desulfomicrobium salsuginis]